jgi:hypothetical protein
MLIFPIYPPSVLRILELPLSLSNLQDLLLWALACSVQPARPSVTGLASLHVILLLYRTSRLSLSSLQLAAASESASALTAFLASLMRLFFPQAPFAPWSLGHLAFHLIQQLIGMLLWHHRKFSTGPR